jgi:hypothetical protein
VSNPICNHCMRQAFHKEFRASQMERHADPFIKVSPRRAHMPGEEKLNKCATPVQWFKQRLLAAHSFGAQGLPHVNHGCLHGKPVEARLKVFKCD